MVSTLPSKPSKSVAATEPIPSVPVLGEPELAEPAKIEPHTRHHQRSNTGPSVYTHDYTEDAKKLNRVLMVLMRRLGNSKTFGENVIFMLNRAGE